MLDIATFPRQSTAPDVEVLDLDAGLTPAALKHLRAAEDISFHRFGARGNFYEKIVVWGTGDKRSQARIELARELDLSGNWWKPPVREAFCSTYGGSNGTWSTIARLLRPGDVLDLDFRADSHANQYCQGAKADHTFLGADKLPLWREGEWTGLHADSLNLVVTRRKGEKVEKLRFLIGVSVCPANSARMIRG